MDVGLNIGFPIDYDAERMFLDIFKATRLWISGNAGAWDDSRVISVDANGWPVSLLGAPAQVVRTLLPEQPAGFAATQYAVLYDGTGTLSYAFDAVLQSSAPGRDVVTIDPAIGNGEANINITATNPAPNHLRNIRMVPLANESDYASKIFSQLFLDRMAPFTALRFMDSGGTNGNNNVRWAHRPTTANPNCDARFLADYWGGTISGTNAKTGSAAPGSPVGAYQHGEVYQGLNTAVSTDAAALTLDVASRGAKRVWGPWGEFFGWFTLSANTQYTFVFDGYLDAWLASASGLSGGMPLETMVALANKTGRHAWFCIPPMADDDYVTQYAACVRDNLNPALKVYIEYMNEAWNGAFPTSSYVKNRGIAAGLSGTDFDRELKFYSRRAVEIFDIFTGVFAGQTSRLVRVMGSQAASTYVSETVLDENNAEAKTDALAIAPYFGGYVGDPSQVPTATVEAMTLDTLFTELRTTALPQAIGWMQSQKATAAARGVALISYEGGQHLAGIGTSQDSLIVMGLFTSANRDARMGDLYRDYLAAWRAAGGGLFMHYTNCGSYSKFGSWGALEYIEQPPANSPKYQALLAALNSSAADLFRAVMVPERVRARIAWPWEDDEKVEPLTAHRVKRQEPRKAAAAKVEMPRAQFATAIGGHEELEEADELAAHCVYAATIAAADELAERSPQLGARRGLPSKSLLAAFLGRFG